MVILRKMNPKFNINDIKLIIGLGNPDNKYKETYHNIGHIFIKYLRKNPSVLYKLSTTDCYMNQSGQFVQRQIDYYKIPPEKLLIIHDDSDITLGKYKLSFERGSAGHKGISSIINHLQSKKFWRLRIGIRPQKYIGKAENFVLSKISKDNKTKYKEIFEIVKKELNL